MHHPSSPLTLLGAVPSFGLKEPRVSMPIRVTGQWTMLTALAAVVVGIGAANGRPAHGRSATVLMSSPSKWAVTTPTRVPKTCPVSKPPVRPFVPPSPYPAKTSRDSFWFGTVKLWTSLPADGTWSGLPHYTPSDPTFRQKLFFWRQGYTLRSELPPHLAVTGRRLDASAPPLGADKANAGWQGNEPPFMVTGINFPTLGCWEVTGEYHGDRLTFVVWLAP
jgi:hypothetical protein